MHVTDGPAERAAPSSRRRARPALATAAAAVVMVGLVGISLSSGSASPGPGAAGSVTPSPTPSAPSRAIPYGEITAGRYHIDIDLHNYGPHGIEMVSGGRVPGGLARVRFDLPPGWSGNGWAVFKGEDDSSGFVSMAPWTIDRVYLDPCHTRGAESRHELADPPMLRSLDGLAQALTAWWGQGFHAEEPRDSGGHEVPTFAPELPTATKPTTVTLAGLDARYVEVRTPSDLDIARCDYGRYRLWADPSGGARYVQGPAQLDRLWIADVGVEPGDREAPGGGRSRMPAADGSTDEVPGGLLVIDAASLPASSQEDLAELQAIVDSIEIEFRGGS